MRVLLNVAKKDNFVFFDHVNRVHLNRTTPFGDVKVLSDSLKRAIIAGNVIDIDDEFEIKVSDKVKKLNDALLKSLNIVAKVKDIVPKEEPKEEVKEEILLEDIEDINPKEEVKEEVKEEKKKKTKTKGVK